MSCCTEGSFQVRPMRRLASKTVFSGLEVSWFLAASPIRRSPSGVKATYDGVMRLPWSLAMISTRPFLNTPTLAERRPREGISTSLSHASAGGHAPLSPRPRQAPLTRNRWSPSRCRPPCPRPPSCPRPRRAPRTAAAAPPPPQSTSSCRRCGPVAQRSLGSLGVQQQAVATERDDDVPI